MTDQRINYLLDQCIRGLCTEAEKEELSSLIRQATNDEKISSRCLARRRVAVEAATPWRLESGAVSHIA